MNRTVIDGKLIVGGVEARCGYCLYWVGLEAAICNYEISRPVCRRYPRHPNGFHIPCGFCGEFLPREPREPVEEWPVPLPNKPQEAKP